MDRLALTRLAKPLAAGCEAGLLLLLCACGPDWRTFQPKDAGFLVAMPGVTRCVGREDSDKGRLPGRTCWVELEPSLVPHRFDATYSVSWSHVPEGLKARGAAPVLRELAARVVPKPQPMSERSTVLGGVNGFEYESRVPVGDGYYLTVRTRFAIQGERLYRISVEGILDSERERVWARMLDTFRFVSGDVE